MSTTDSSSLIGWFIAGSHRDDYLIAVDIQQKHGGKASGMLASKPSQHEGFGTIMQWIRAERYMGKRIRLSAYVKSKEVSEWAGLWMRVDERDVTMSSFDNMENRPILGTTDWTRYEIILDVSQSAVVVAFGLLLGGQGQVWLNDVMLEVVSSDLVTTDLISRQLLSEALLEEEKDEQSRADYAKRIPDILKKLRDEPENMDFEIK